MQREPMFLPGKVKHRCLIAISLSMLLFCRRSSPSETVTIAEDFATDPQWDGRNNVRTERGREKRQDFGFSQMNYAWSRRVRSAEQCAAPLTGNLWHPDRPEDTE